MSVLKIRAIRSRAHRPSLIGAAGALAAVALVATLAAPASAAPTPADPSTPPPALSAFQNQTSVDAGDSATVAPGTRGFVGADPASNSAGTIHAASGSFATAVALVGKRQTFTRGGALAWSSDTFEWYWKGATMSSSSAYQASGYVFPNTVTLLGVKRTLAATTEHLWHGTASIGAGVVTPWGSVDVYSTTITDNFTLRPGSLTHTN